MREMPVWAKTWQTFRSWLKPDPSITTGRMIAAIVLSLPLFAVLVCNSPFNTVAIERLAKAHASEDEAQLISNAIQRIAPENPAEQLAILNFILPHIVYYQFSQIVWGSDRPATLHEAEERAAEKHALFMRVLGAEYEGVREWRYPHGDCKTISVVALQVLTNLKIPCTITSSFAQQHAYVIAFIDGKPYELNTLSEDQERTITGPRRWALAVRREVIALSHTYRLSWPAWAAARPAGFKRPGLPLTESNRGDLVALGKIERGNDSRVYNVRY